jgi:hypothetical protein
MYKKASMADSKDVRPSPAAAMNNLSVKMPWRRKLRMAMGNYWIRIAKRQDCCGHPGEPGC